MKLTIASCLFLVVVLGLSSCVPAGSTAEATQLKSPLPSLTPIPATSTVTPISTPVMTLPATLGPEQAQETIRTLMQDSVDCEAPCFWGILPESTTFAEANNVLAHLGLSLKFTTTIDGRDFYAGDFNLGNGIEVSPVIGVQNQTVMSLDVSINDTSQAGTPRKWSAYSPETLISRYGPPSRVDFFLGRVAPTPTHLMVMYFEKADLIVEYVGTNLLNDGSELEICPLTNQVDFLKIWMGDDPQYPPRPGVPLEHASSLTMQEFSALMTGPSSEACLNLKEEAFPR